MLLQKQIYWFWNLDTKCNVIGGTFNLTVDKLILSNHY
jgi:hypothetical protein